MAQERDAHKCYFKLGRLLFNDAFLLRIAGVIIRVTLTAYKYSSQHRRSTVNY